MKTYELMGARGGVIAYTAHPLVVERSYPDRVLCRDRLRCKLPQPYNRKKVNSLLVQLVEGFLSIHPFYTRHFVYRKKVN